MYNEIYNIFDIKQMEKASQFDFFSKNKNFLNNQNYVITKKTKRKIIRNYEQIKTYVNGKQIIKYEILGKYKIVNEGQIGKENILNNIIFMGVPTIVLIIFIIGMDIIGILFSFFILFLIHLAYKQFNTKNFKILKNKNEIFYYKK